MRRFHLPHWPRALYPHWPDVNSEGLHLPEAMAHPSGRVVDEVAAIVAILAVCALLVLAF